MDRKKMITVEQLIRELEQYEPTALVVVNGNDHSFRPANTNYKLADISGRQMFEYHHEETPIGRIAPVLVFE